VYKADEEMRRAAGFVSYEMGMFLWAASQIPPDPGATEWRKGTSGVEYEDAIVEVVLLHTRVLRDFLGKPRKELKNFERTNIVADDFFDRPEDWTKPTFNYLATNHERLNRALVHVAYDRATYEGDKDWDFKAITDEIGKAWETFLASLPQDRCAWFG
jgi:hypothetical protein